jgi:hypothetical protein
MSAGWGVFEPGNGDIHVAPLSDEKPHDLTPDCTCEPTTKMENGHLIFVHKAFDFREVYEWLHEQA